MEYASIGQVSHRRSVNPRVPNGQSIAHPVFSRPTSSPSPLSNRRSVPTMRASSDPFSQNQFPKPDPRGGDAAVGPTIYSFGSPTDPQITSSSYGSILFSNSIQSQNQHFCAQPPAELHAGSAPSLASIDAPRVGSSQHTPAAPGYSETGINGLGNNSSDEESDDIDGSSCMLFESTINGDNEVVPRYGDLSNHGEGAETKISLSSAPTARSGNPAEDDEECDADIFDSFIPVHGRPTAALPTVAGGTVPHYRTITPPSLQTLGTSEPVPDGSRPLSASTATSSTLSTPDTNVFRHYLGESSTVLVGDPPAIVAAPDISSPLYTPNKATRAGIGEAPWHPQQHQSYRQHPHRFVNVPTGEYKPLRSASLPGVTAEQHHHRYHQQQHPTTESVIPPRIITAPAPPQALQQQTLQDKWNAQPHQYPHTWAPPNGCAGVLAGTEGDRYTTSYAMYDEAKGTYVQSASHVGTPYGAEDRGGFSGGGLQIRTGVEVGSGACRNAGVPNHYAAVASWSSQ